MRVAVAVDLNDQCTRWAVEIRDVRPERVLTPELHARDLFACRPRGSFCGDNEGKMIPRNIGVRLVEV